MAESFTVTRYPVPKAAEVRLHVTRGARRLCVRTVNYVRTPQEIEADATDALHAWDTPDRPMIYFAHSIHETRKEYRTFHIIPTGSVSPPANMSYFGTFEIESGVLAFHVFEAPDDQAAR